MNDLAAGIVEQEHRCQQPHDVIALNKPSFFVEEEAAVEVSVPGDANISAMGVDGRNGGSAILRKHRIRDAVREVAVRFMVHFAKLKRQMRLERIDDQARAAIAGIDHDGQRLQCGRFHIGQKMRNVGCIVSMRRRTPARFGSPNSPRSAKPRISCKPLSALMGLDASRTNFMPL